MKNFYLEQSLGIDIRENSVCLALLGKSLHRTDLLGCEYIPIKLLTKGNRKAESMFLEQVNRFIVEHDAWTENVIVCIPRSKLTLQSFELPSPDLKSVNSMMGFELERHFSSSIENFYYSNCITNKESNLFHIACAAINKEIANHYLTLLKKLNLNTSILDVSTFANLNLLYSNVNSQDTLSVLIDLSYNFLEVSIIVNQKLEISRNIPIEETGYRESFLNRENQEKSNQNISEKITPLIVEEIKNALSACKNIEDSKSVETIFISGGGYIAKQLASELESLAGVQVVRLQLPDSINVTANNNFSIEFMATSLSLALRGTKRNPIEVNLLPENLITKKTQKVNIKRTALLALATIVFIIVFILNQSVQNKAILTSLEEQLEEIKIHMGPLEKVDLEYKVLQKYTNTLNKIDELNPTKLPLLVELSQIIPKNTWIKKIQFRNKKIELNGVSKNASQLLPIIEKSSHFRGTHFVGTITNESIGEKFTINTALGPE
jgi:Tfp pilus assembly PilM family ATPase